MTERPTHQVAPDQWVQPPDPAADEHVHEASTVPTSNQPAAATPAPSPLQSSLTPDSPTAGPPAPHLTGQNPPATAEPSPGPTPAYEQPPVGIAAPMTHPTHPASSPAWPPGTGPTTPHTTLVIEEGVFPSRLRRPRDLLGAVLAIVVGLLVVVVAVTAQQTAIAIDDDLTDAQRSLPDVIWGMLSALAALGVVMLPLVAAVSTAHPPARTPAARVDRGDDAGRHRAHPDLHGGA